MNLPGRIPVSIRALWLAVLVLSLVRFGIHLRAAHVAGSGVLAAALIFALFVLAWAYMSLRLGFLHGRLTNFLRRLLAGEYETGIRDISWIQDEVSRLTALANKAGERILAYDKLRSERTGLSFRAMDTIFRRAGDCIALANMEKQTIRFNPPALTLFNATQETYTFEALEKPEENRRFIRLFLLTVLKDVVTKEWDAQLRLPMKDVSHRLHITVIPFKDNSEKAALALLLLKPANPVGRQP